MLGEQAQHSPPDTIKFRNVRSTAAMFGLDGARQASVPQASRSSMSSPPATEACLTERTHFRRGQKNLSASPFGSAPVKHLVSPSFSPPPFPAPLSTPVWGQHLPHRTLLISQRYDFPSRHWCSYPCFDRQATWQTHRLLVQQLPLVSRESFAS